MRVLSVVDELSQFFAPVVDEKPLEVDAPTVTEFPAASIFALALTDNAPDSEYEAETHFWASNPLDTADACVSPWVVEVPEEAVYP
jgi:hypothetical protein